MLNTASYIIMNNEYSGNVSPHLAVDRRNLCNNLSILYNRTLIPYENSKGMKHTTVAVHLRKGRYCRENISIIPPSDIRRFFVITGRIEHVRQVH